MNPQELQELTTIIWIAGRTWRYDRKNELDKDAYIARRVLSLGYRRKAKLVNGYMEGK